MQDKSSLERIFSNYLHFKMKLVVNLLIPPPLPELKGAMCNMNIYQQILWRSTCSNKLFSPHCTATLQNNHQNGYPGKIMWHNSSHEIQNYPTTATFNSVPSHRNQTKVSCLDASKLHEDNLSTRPIGIIRNWEFNKHNPWHLQWEKATC